MGELDLQMLDTAQPAAGPRDQDISSRPASETKTCCSPASMRSAPPCKRPAARAKNLATLAPEAVAALRDAGMFRLKLPTNWAAPKSIRSPKCWCWKGSPITTSRVAGARWSAPQVIAALGTFLPQAGLDRVFGQRQFPTAAISFFPGRPRGARQRRLPAQRPLAFQQRHPSLRMGPRRHRRRGHRAQNGGQPHGHLLGHADQGCHALRQLARCHRPERHRQLRLLGGKLLPARAFQLRLGFAQAAAAPRRGILSAAALQPTWRRSTAASRSAPRGVRSTS